MYRIRAGRRNVDNDFLRANHRTGNTRFPCPVSHPTDHPDGAFESVIIAHIPPPWSIRRDHSPNTNPRARRGFVWRRGTHDLYDGDDGFRRRPGYCGSGESEYEKGLRGKRCLERKSSRWCNWVALMMVRHTFSGFYGLNLSFY